ncbi:MAG: hypothetical protein ACI90A_000473, partial [Shewanella sp.]
MGEIIMIRKGEISDLSALIQFNLAMAKETEDLALDEGVLTTGV